jgi:hypothetical protein
MNRLRTVIRGSCVAGVAATVLVASSANAYAANICSGLAAAIARTSGLAKAILQAISTFLGC